MDRHDDAIPDLEAPPAERLRRALTRGDVETFLDLVQDRLPGAPGNATRINYLSSLRRYVRWAQAELRSVLHASRDDADVYRAHLLAKHGHAPATVHNHLARVRTLYGVLIDLAAHEGPNPFVDQALPTHRPEAHRDVYAPEEVTRLLAHADVEGRALVWLGAFGGLAGPEVVALRWEDVDLAAGVVRLPGRTLALDADARAALAAYGRERGHTELFAASGKVFEVATPHALRAAVYRLCREANVPYRAWHALRHHAALHRTAQSGDPGDAAVFLGLRQRRNVVTTEKAAGERRERGRTAP